MSDLDARLLAAHAADDTDAVSTLDQEAAGAAADDTARAFYLTQAHGCALERGHPDAAALRAALVSMGREVPL